jgi:hypothetical protein
MGSEEPGRCPVGVLARAQQDAVWHRNRIANELRSLLREFYPGFLTAFVNRTDGLAAPMARRVLVLAPAPAASAAPTAACRVSRRCPAPACSPRSATTGRASPTLERSRPTPAPRG